ncbi:MAG: hypothetical protein R3B07_34865 [Polyangiaceae bacterium]
MIHGSFVQGLTVASVLFLSCALGTGCSSGDDKSVPSVAEADLTTRVVSAICDAGRKCSCDAVPPSCEETLAGYYTPTPSQTEGLTYDAQCGGQLVAHYESLSACGGIQERSSCCRLYYGTKGAGASCGGANGDLDDCGKGLRCDGGTCVALCGGGKAQLGQSCESSTCADGLWCDYYSGETAVCARLPGAGESCYDSYECAAGLRCVALGSDDVCVIPGAIGAACEPYTCGDGLGCIDGVCAKSKPVGSLCSMDDECDSGICEGACQNPTPEACFYFQ